MSSPRLSLPESASLRDAIAVIDEGGLQVCVILHPSGKVAGVLTDGDIRRALLSGAQLDDTISRYVCQDFAFIHEPLLAQVNPFALMRAKGIHQLPVLDTDGYLVKVLTTREMDREGIPNQVVFMAGGKGTRMRPLTDSIPKPMLPVGGRPMLQISLERCVESGLRRFTIAVNHLGERIMEHFGDGSAWGVEIGYVVESEALGTAGALGQLDVHDGHPVLVMNGDVLTRVDIPSILRFHVQNQGALATICGRIHEFQIPYGVISADGTSLEGIQEKPVIKSLVNAGIYVLDAQVVASIPRERRIDMTDLLMNLVGGGSLVNVFPIHEYWLDAGHPSDFERAQSDWVGLSRVKPTSLFYTLSGEER